jgi:GxxExxY protein
MAQNKLMTKLYSVSDNVFRQLGVSFGENAIQAALAIEFRKLEISYLKETNIEVLYDNQAVTTGRLDFLLLPCRGKGWFIKQPLIIETKVAQKLDDEQRKQLQGYIQSARKAKDSLLKRVTHGVLINFPKHVEFYDDKKYEDYVTLELWQYKPGEEKIQRADRLPLEQNCGEKPTVG